MQRVGFIHDMMDVKILILFVMSRVNYPASAQEIYEICYQDECLSYFDVCAALPEMVESGHLTVAEEQYEITDKGREDCVTTEDSIAFTVKRRAEDAVERFNRRLRQIGLVHTRTAKREDGDYSVVMTLDNDFGNAMTLELIAPDEVQAGRLSRRMEQKAEDVYNMVMTVLLDDEDISSE